MCVCMNVLMYERMYICVCVHVCMLSYMYVCHYVSACLCIYIFKKNLFTCTEVHLTFVVLYSAVN